MGALTEVYVDPSIAGDSGTGTIGDPYGDLQYAFNTKARDSTNGDRFNLKTGTAEVLAANLTLATYGTPTAAAPLILQGYTSAADDGGFAEIDGDGSYGVFSSTAYSYVWCKNLKVHNTGDQIALRLGSACLVDSCEVYDCTNSTSLLQTGDSSQITRNYCHGYSESGYAINCGTSRHVAHNFIDITGSAKGISNSGPVTYNIIKMANGLGIVPGANSVIQNNTIFGSGGTGTGIYYASALTIINNIIEGLSGSGGKAIILQSDRCHGLIGFNAFYNNETNYSVAPEFKWPLEAFDISLSASPFKDAANNDFRLNPGAIQRSCFPQATRLGLSFTDYNFFGAVAPMPSMRRSRAVMIG